MSFYPIQGNDEAADDDEEDDEDDDEEYQEEVEANGSAFIDADQPPASVTGVKRGRDSDEDKVGEPQIEGDYGEFEENSAIVNKRARTSDDEF